MTAKEIKEQKEAVRSEFVQILREEIVDVIESRNWIDFNYDRYTNKNIIILTFLAKDGIGDTIFIAKIHHNKTTNKWYDDDYDGIEFDSFEKLKKFMDSKEEHDNRKYCCQQTINFGNL